MHPPNTSFSRRGPDTRGEDAQVVELLIAAAEFATFSMDRLIRQFDDDGAELRKIYYDYAALTHTLEVSFLFPNIASAERETLSRILAVRNSLLVGLRGNRQWRTDEQRREHNATLEKLSHEFLVLKAVVVNGQLRDRLSTVQRRLLDQEFLDLPASAAKGDFSN